MGHGELRVGLRGIRARTQLIIDQDVDGVGEDLQSFDICLSGHNQLPGGGEVEICIRCREFNVKTSEVKTRSGSRCSFTRRIHLRPAESEIERLPRE
jgi:hypothetical protein